MFYVPNSPKILSTVCKGDLQARFLKKQLSGNNTSKHKFILKENSVSLQP